MVKRIKREGEKGNKEAMFLAVYPLK